MADDRRGRILQFARDFLKANLLEGDSEIGEMLELEPLPKAAEIDAAFAPAPPVDFDAQRREDEAFGRDVIAKLDRIPSPLLRHLVALAVDSLSDSESEPCYKCGHSFYDHEFPDDGQPYCSVGPCTRHAFKGFPDGWGVEPSRTSL